MRGVRHEREQSGGFHGDGFAAGIGAADQQAAALFVELEAEMGTIGLRCLRRTDSSSGWRASRSRARRDWLKRGMTAVVIEREGGFGEDAIEFR